MRFIAPATLVAFVALLAAEPAAALADAGVDVGTRCQIGYDCDFCDIYQYCEETFNLPPCDPDATAQVMCGSSQWICILWNPNICL